MEFKNLTAKKTYFLNKKYRIGLCESVKTYNETDFLEFCELFKSHPDYDEKINDIIDISINPNYYNNNTELQIIKKDKSARAISLLECCKGNVANKNIPIQNLKSAMRNSISTQINEFRRKNPIEICNKCQLMGKVDVDHHNPTFQQIYNNFMKINKLNLPTEFNNHISNSSIFKDDDIIFNETWQKYHMSNCNLRYLCHLCNLKRPKH